jgi:hypothetical protein
MLVQLPPVRRAVSLRRLEVAAGKAAFHAAVPGYTAHLYDSGTSALAVAIAAASRRHGSSNPEAILPAYCCPDVIAACLFASVRPRLVDVPPGQWGYDTGRLRAALNSNTVAVVAVNLLGCGDDAAALLPLARANGSFLIQDSAQYLPGRGQSGWLGDYVVLSFGRGKPLNLLRGGALAVPQEQPLDTGLGHAGSFRQRFLAGALGTRLAGVAFNTITHPRAYWLTSRLPGLGLGSTTFHPLQSVVTPPQSFWGQLGAAYSQYCAEEWRLPWVDVLPESMLLSCTGAPAPPDTRRLRLALLARDRLQRDRIVQALERAGLGASVMYDVALNSIAGVPGEIAACRDIRNAEGLAGRLFTLPTHSGVTRAMVARAAAIIRDQVAS